MKSARQPKIIKPPHRNVVLGKCESNGVGFIHYLFYILSFVDYTFYSDN